MEMEYREYLEKMAYWPVLIMLEYRAVKEILKAYWRKKVGE